MGRQTWSSDDTHIALTISFFVLWSVGSAGLLFVFYSLGFPLHEITDLAWYLQLLGYGAAICAGWLVGYLLVWVLYFVAQRLPTRAHAASWALVRLEDLAPPPLYRLHELWLTNRADSDVRQSNDRDST